MSNIFQDRPRPVLSGTYVDFDIRQEIPPPLSPGRIVAIVVTGTWGPFEQVTEVLTTADYVNKFGVDTANPTGDYIAVRAAFLGEGVPGAGGAGGLLVYRAGAAAAAKATKALMNTTATLGVTLNAKYQGSTGNTLSVTTQASASDVTKNELLVLRGSTVVETYRYLKTNLASLVTMINQSSAWVTATLGTDGTALALLAASPLTGGVDANTLVAQDYTDAIAAFGAFTFGAMTFQNLTDQSIMASALDAERVSRDNGRPYFLTVGGALDESITTAVSRSAALNDPAVLNLGVGSYYDDTLLDAAGNPTLMSPATLAPRVAGILAFRGARKSLTFARLGGVRIRTGPSVSNLVTAYDGGVITVSRFSDPSAGVRLDKGISAYTTQTDPARPFTIFRQPKFVATMMNLQYQLQAWGDRTVIGEPIDQDLRDAVVAHTNTLLALAEANGEVQAGWYVHDEPPVSETDDYMVFTVFAAFGRSAEQVFFQLSLG